MNVRVLLLLEELLVVQPGQPESDATGVELLPGLLNHVETAVVVIDISVPSGAIGLVDNAPVTHHVLSIVVDGCTRFRRESADGYVLVTYLIGKHSGIK